MRAVIFHGPGKPITLEDIPLPACGDHDVIVKVHRAGICGSDVQLTGGGPYAFSPGQIGHEFSGEVVETGKRAGKLKVGQRVACLHSAACGRCEACRRGAARNCTSKLRNSVGVNGHQGFSDYAVLHWRCAVPLPDSLSDADGAMIEPMACGLHALRMAKMRGGSNILVLGAGSMALSLVYWARRLGADRVIAASRSATRRDVMLAFGANDLIALGENDADRVRQALGGEPDLVAECVGKPGMLQRALEFVRPGGTIVSMGLGMEWDPILPAMASFKEAGMVFPLAFSLAEFRSTIRAFEEDGFHPSLAVSEVIGLEAVPEKIEAIRASGGSGGKVQVDPLNA